MKLPPKASYSHAQLFDFARQDLIADAECSEAQAANGPFYPGITRETLLAYAAECRQKADAMTARARTEYVGKCVRHTLASASPCPLPV